MKILISRISGLVLLFLLLLPATGFAQYEAVDAKVRTYPKSFTTPERLAARISSDFPSETDRARALFTWMATHIRYDLKAYYAQANGGVAYSFSSPEDKARKDREFRMKLSNGTLRSGKAICEGYASLFIVTCNLMGMDAVIVPGTSKSHYSQIGKLPKSSDHAWNAVKADGKWYLLDITWAAGYVNPETDKFVPRFNDIYFFTDPDRFFLNHFPDDPKWLLTKKSAEDFAALPYHHPEYLRSDYKLSADEGHILFPKNVAVRFNIENLQATDRVAYITSRDNTLDQVTVDEDNNFVIFPSAKLSGYLTIFVNERPLVSYKIVKG
jgi:transglutaminase/protease-like cytokinesis protein 3